MYEQFKAKAEGVGAEVHRFARETEALEFLRALLKTEGTAQAGGPVAVWAPGALRDGAGKVLLSLPGITGAVTREAAAGARIGISEVDWALADTGTLVQDQSAPEQRLVSSLTELHVAILRSGTILSDKLALLSKIDPRKSRYIAFITGPSRTADIERVLTIGVHGPKRVLILCIDETGVAA
ncbi:LutC/YkgG family protein [Geomesophilobacter sediminis]|uniref:Lactate utilization protein n=1 Tax=Geomesophilobacter sediminis TaxID=2798584 RepID=A0A8J7IN66_9BACT|nr:lactate utilization protein [Geomesophilobacter sediminis]MBJ6723409.1 lactate utilization protein [Geomesophilobacter sediminis]